MAKTFSRWYDMTQPPANSNARATAQRIWTLGDPEHERVGAQHERGPEHEQARFLSGSVEIREENLGLLDLVRIKGAAAGEEAMAAACCSGTLAHRGIGK